MDFGHLNISNLIFHLFNEFLVGVDFYLQGYKKTLVPSIREFPGETWFSNYRESHTYFLDIFGS